MDRQPFDAVTNRRIAPARRARVPDRAVLAAFLLAIVAALGDPAAAQERAVPQSREEIQLSFAPVVKTVAPAVVNIFASKTVAQRRSPLFDDPFFRRFFGDDFGVFGRERERKENSLGSGVIVDASGLVVTNHHVIAGADEIRVVLADRREFAAELVLDDARTDLAVLQLDASGGALPQVAFRDSDSIEVGDLVLAIGNPFGVGQTVTSGIVSATARTQVGVSDYSFFIQTDAAINPGNSGGALLDMSGRLVGINTAIFSRSGGSNGIGFAIPSNMVHFVVDAAENDGRVRRPWLGASLQSVSAEIAEALGLDRPSGVLVTVVGTGSPAERAGLKVGDLITHVGDIEVTDPDSFGYRFATRTLGSTTTLTVLRPRGEVKLEVALEAAPETVPRDAREISDYSPFAGTTVMNLSPAVAEELRLDGFDTGVVITRIEPGSPAARVGLQVGDVVQTINGREVDTTGTLQRIAGSDPGVWRLEIRRGGRVLRIALRG